MKCTGIIQMGTIPGKFADEMYWYYTDGYTWMSYRQTDKENIVCFVENIGHLFRINFLW